MKKLIVCRCTFEKQYLEILLVKVALRLSEKSRPYGCEEEQRQAEYHVASCKLCNDIAQKNNERFYASKKLFVDHCDQLHMLVNFLVDKGNMPEDLLDEYGGQQASGFDEEEMAEFAEHLEACEICRKYKSIIQHGWKMPSKKTVEKLGYLEQATQAKG